MPECSVCHKPVEVWGYVCNINCYSHFYAYLGLVGPILESGVIAPLDMPLQPWAKREDDD